LLTGRVAYEGGTAMSKLLAHRDDPIPSLMATRMNMPPDLDRVFQKMAAKRPEQRYASMSEVIADLERCLQEVPLSAEDSQFFACERDAGSMDDFDTAPTEFGSALQPADESTLAISDIQSEYDTQPRGEPLAQPATSNHAVAASSRTTTSWIRSRAMRWSLAAGGTVAAATVGFWFARDHLPIPKTEIGKAGIASSKLDDSVGENLSAKEKSLNVTPSPLSSATAITTASGQNPTPSIRLPEPLSPQPVEDVAKARRRLTELDRELEKNPESVGAFNERSLWHKRLGMWREAITDVERMADLQPDLSIIRMQVVYIGVLAGDLDAYRRTCRYLIDNFGHSENVDDLERVCKAPLFVAGEFDLLTLPIQRFEESIHLDIPDRGSMTWACVTRAYVACQAGQPEEALTWLAKREPPRAAFHLWTYSRFVRAQALHKLGRSDDARAAFDEAVSLMPADLAKQLDGKLEPETLLSSESVHGDWLILTILRRQTQLLLDGPG
jgi:tetratricopeptide (TPR) repeat protein